jgi:hypothetical protein
MIQGLLRAAKSPAGRMVFSAIMGLGLASLFRRTCRALDCFSFRAPPWDEVTGSVYSYGGQCYKFSPRAGPCGVKGRQQVRVA